MILILGRFLSVDPLFEAFREQGAYNYAFNSPVNWKDPSGLAPVDEKGNKLLLAENPVFNNGDLESNITRQDDMFENRPGIWSDWNFMDNYMKMILSPIDKMLMNEFGGGGGTNSLGGTMSDDVGTSWSSWKIQNAKDVDRYWKTRGNNSRTGDNGSGTKATETSNKSLAAEYGSMFNIGANLIDGATSAAKEHSSSILLFVSRTVMWITNPGVAAASSGEVLPTTFEISLGGESTAGIGIYWSLNVSWLFVGDDASIWPILSITVGGTAGLNPNAGVSARFGWFYGEMSTVSRDILWNNSFGEGSSPTVFGSFNMGVLGGMGGGITPYGGGVLIEAGGSWGFSALPGGGSIGISNTYFLFDFSKYFSKK